MNYVARKRCTCLSSTTIFANRIVPGHVHLPRHLRPLCPGVSPTHLNRGERRRPVMIWRLWHTCFDHREKPCPCSPAVEIDVVAPVAADHHAHHHRIPSWARVS